MQLRPQLVPLHVAEPFGSPGHAEQDEVPHELMLELLAQEPPHRWYPELQLIPQLVPLQVGDPFGSPGQGEHEEVPHDETLELLEHTPRHEWYEALQVIPHDVPTQIGVPLGSVGHDATTSCHVPVEEQVCGRVGLEAHCVAPGAHTPLHTPLTQVLLVQATAVPHWPFEPQV